MHSAFEEICKRLDQIVTNVGSAIPNDEPFNQSHGWNQAGVARTDLVEAASEIAKWIRERDPKTPGPMEKRVTDFWRRLDYLRDHTIPQLWGGNGINAVPAYFLTLDALKRVLVAAIPQEANDDVAARVNRAARRTRAIEARLNELEPRTTSLDAQIERIGLAHEAADQLPEDLESLAEARAKISSILDKASSEYGKIETASERAADLSTSLQKRDEAATAVVARCESAYSAATSQGLARAFAIRSSQLSKSMWTWVCGLVVALCLGAIYGSHQISALAELMKGGDVPGAIVATNLLLAVLSVGAPVWFAWLATKQVGQRFRLAEDYAFKAAVSSAYEGYRREAARIDEDMEASLLASALSRLDEQPLRLVEPVSHGSPWHELMSCDAVRTAVGTVPGFVGTVTTSAKQALAKLRHKKVGDTSDEPSL